MTDDVARLRALVDGLVELYVETAEALEAAQFELQQLSVTEPPVPDALQLALDERLILLDTLHRIKAGAAAGKQVTPRRIDATYLAACKRGHHDPYELPKYAVDEAVLKGIEEAQALVERRVLSDRDIDHALRSAKEGGWAW